MLKQSVTVPDGTEQLHFTVSYPTSAVGIVVMKNDQFLLINQYRFRINQPVWAIPSGGVSQGESPEQAAQRELVEDTGLKCLNLEPS